MQQFLAAILPPQGVYFIAAKSPNGFIHTPCNDFEAMELHARQIDAQGLDAYFACASYQNASYTDTNGAVRQRTAENAVAAKSFWFDIDCGAEKAASNRGYENVVAAEKALDIFIEAVNLPQPIIVQSGSGLHVYWPLTAAIDKSAWKVTAGQLKALTQSPSIGLLADPSRTSDIASVLRPVETHNYKSGNAAAPVELLIDAPATKTDDFIMTVSVAHERLVADKGQINSRVNLGALSSSSWPETTENIQVIKSALAAIDPDFDYQVWRDILFALKSTGWSCAEQLARDWSMGCLK